MKPILFNTEMVQAILDDRKTVTRRIIKGSPKDVYYVGWMIDSGNVKSYGVICFDINGSRKYFKTHYLIGDVLYVRETWQKSPAGTFIYKTDNNGNLTNGHVLKWKPSIHMPKEAARLFLRITDVRVERVKDIRDCEQLSIYGLDANTWVWVYEFEVITKEEAMEEENEAHS